MAYENQSPVYQNVVTKVEEQSKPSVVAKSRAARKYENSPSNECASLRVGEKAKNISKSSLRQKINYTDIMLDSPEIPASTKPTEDYVEEMKAPKPIPPKKPVHLNTAPENTNDFNSSFEEDTVDASDEMHNEIGSPGDLKKSYTRDLLACSLCFMVILAIVISVSAISLTVLNFNSSNLCQTRSTSCTITHNQTCDAYFSSNSTIEVRQVWKRVVHMTSLTTLSILYIGVEMNYHFQMRLP